jgi:hypothetical protein
MPNTRPESSDPEIHAPTPTQRNRDLGTPIHEDGAISTKARFVFGNLHRGLQSICLTLSTADVPRRAEFTAIDVELDPSVHTPLVGDRERVALTAVGGLWSAIGPPVRPMALLPGGGSGELAADAITLAPRHYTIVSRDKSRLGGGSREGSEATSRTRLTRKPAAFGVPMAYFGDESSGFSPLSDESR